VVIGFYDSPGEETHREKDSLRFGFIEAVRLGTRQTGR